MSAVTSDEFVERTTAAAPDRRAGHARRRGEQRRVGVHVFIPYALLTAELGSTFTEEGGSYICVKLAFGRFTAAIQSVL